MSRMLSRQPPIFDSGSDRSPVGGAFSVVLCYVACSKVRCLRAKRPTSRPRSGVRGPPSHDLCVTTRSPRSGQQTFSRRWYCAGKSEAVLPSFRHSGRSVAVGRSTANCHAIPCHRRRRGGLRSVDGGDPPDRPSSRHPIHLYLLSPSRLSNMADKMTKGPPPACVCPPVVRCMIPYPSMIHPSIHLWRVGRKLSRYRDQTVVFLLVGRSVS